MATERGPLPADVRNPWSDGARAAGFSVEGARLSGREFLWDARRPGKFLRRGYLGLRGRNAGLDPAERFAGLAFLGAGGIYVVGGVVLVLASGLSGHGWLP